MISIAAEELDSDGKREWIIVDAKFNGDWEIHIFKTIDFRSFQNLSSSFIQENIVITT